MTYLDSLYGKRAELTDAATAVLDRAATDDRALNDDERERVKGYQVECRKLDEEITDIEAVNESGNRFASMLGKRAERAEIKERAARREASDTPEGGNPPAPARDMRPWGQRVTDSAEFAAFGGTGTSGRISVPGFLETRAAIDTTTLNPPPFNYTPGTPNVLTPLLNSIARVRTSAGSVEYLSWSSAQPAAVVAEGAPKPEAVALPTPTPLPLVTYAHWKAITRQALEDVPQVRSIVENILRRGLALALDQAAAAAINGATLGTTPGGVGGLGSGLRIAAGEVQGRGYAPDTVLLNPADFAALDVGLASPLNPATAPGGYWGLTPVASPQVPAGTAFVGDFMSGVTWFDRGDESVYLSDSHSDYFIRNLLVILAEVRAAFAVTEPAALQEVTGTVAPGGAAAAVARK
jgi:hypothetical protein